MYGPPGTLPAAHVNESGPMISKTPLRPSCERGGSERRSSFSIFSFEGSTDTQAYLHETSHAVFRLGDEYDGHTYYFEAATEPNIFDLESTCRAEQVDKKRDPDDCYEFTTRQTGWWGTHGNPTVMTNGRSYHPWSKESVERLEYWFGKAK